MHSKSLKCTKQLLFKKKYKFHYSTITEGGGCGGGGVLLGNRRGVRLRNNDGKFYVRYRQ